MSNKLKVIAVLLPISLLSGCNGTIGSGSQKTTIQGSDQPTNTISVPTAETENPTPAAGGAVRIARWSYNPKEGSMAALKTGPLAIVNNCLVMSNKYSPPTLVIFPYNYGVWDDVNRTFTYEGKVIKIGETIKVGGGSIPNFDVLKANGKYDVPDCGITDFWLAP